MTPESPPPTKGEEHGDVSWRKLPNDETFVFRSSEMREVVKLALGTNLLEEEPKVLLLGETGVGKGRVAELIHYNSGRNKKPFEAINCAAIAPSLLESELFGHVKGAFTGATTNKKGILQTVENGTLFLDEIGEMDSDLQCKLLRVLQERKFRPVGSHNGEESFEGRVITATNQDIAAALRGGKLRKDLYYRISTVPLIIPPLRKRPEDIDPLIDYFLNRQKRGLKLSDEAREKLKKYPFPGNVREMESLLTRAQVYCLIRSDGINIKAEHIVFDELGDYSERSSEANLRALPT